MKAKNDIGYRSARPPSGGWAGGAWLLLSLTLLYSCTGSSKKINRRITLGKADKIPYGCYFAYENLKTLFPVADITVNKKSPATFFEDSTVKKAYIIIVPRMAPDSDELNGIMNFVGQGNIVFISAFRFGDSLLHSLKIKTGNNLTFYNFKDSLQLSVNDPLSHDSLSFVYPGRAYDDYVDSLEPQYTTVLGRDRQGRPDFVRFDYKSGGALYLQFAPMAFTNFFLLHKQNKVYYDKVFSYLPGSVSEVKWDEYFRYDHKTAFSAIGYILSDPSLKWAFWLLLLLFLLIYVFESKRRQRMIPVIGAVRNNSLDFVKTIGRLYYQRRDNHNLALKMVAHFQDHVRTRYNMPATILDDEFVSRLFYKTGFSREYVQEIVKGISALQLDPWIKDEELLAFNAKMKAFYKQA